MSAIRATLNKIHDKKINEIKEKTIDIKAILNLTNKNVIYNQIFDRVQNRKYRYMKKKKKKMIINLFTLYSYLSIFHRYQ